MTKHKRFSKEFKSNASKNVAEYHNLMQDKNHVISVTILPRWLK